MHRWRDRPSEATAYEVAILPWGATEAHNYHLPYATDVIECDAIAAEAARIAWERGARAVVLPTVPFGVNTGQLDIKLCLNMNPSTQASLLHDLVSALESQGISKLVIVNGHGGNDFRQMIRELQPHTKMCLCALTWRYAKGGSGLPARGRVCRRTPAPAIRPWHRRRRESDSSMPLQHASPPFSRSSQRPILRRCMSEPGCTAPSALNTGNAALCATRAPFVRTIAVNQRR